MMEVTILIDALLGMMLLITGFVLKRIFYLFDNLMKEDKVLHDRITQVATESVSRTELNGAIDRVLSRIDKMEERLMSKP
jgi:hypothetical protein